MLSSLDRALDVLEYLADCTGDVGVREIARYMDLSHATVFRIIKTLEMHQFVAQDLETKKYKLGVATIRIGQASARRFELIQISKPILKSLSEELNETVFLLVLQGGFGSYSEKYESNKALRVHAKVGNKLPLYRGAAPKAILANLSLPKINTILDQSTKEIGEDFNRKKFLLELEKVKNEGYAISRGEIDAGVIVIGVPIFGMNNEVIASVGIPMPDYLVDDEYLNRIIALLMQKAKKISVLLGYREMNEK